MTELDRATGEQRFLRTKQFLRELMRHHELQGEGQSAREIAEALGVSRRTVFNHRRLLRRAERMAMTSVAMRER